MSKVPGMFWIHGASLGVATQAWLEDWRCGYDEAMLYDVDLVLPSGAMLELPGKPHDRGKLPVCEVCPNQLSCLAGIENKLTNGIVRSIEPGREYW